MRAGTQLASWLQRISASASRTTHKGNGDGGKCERVANDATDAEGRALAVAVSIFHFAQRRGAQRAVRGHVSVSMAEGARTRAGCEGVAVWCVLCFAAVLLLLWCVLAARERERECNHLEMRMRVSSSGHSGGICESNGTGRKKRMSRRAASFSRRTAARSQ
jgi:hypothetical protein